VGVPAHSRSGEVGVREEAPLPIKRRAVTMETRGEEDHNVGLFTASVFDLLVGNLVESQWGHLLPNVERPTDGFVRVVFPDLGSVVLDATETNQGREKSISLCGFIGIKGNE